MASARATTRCTPAARSADDTASRVAPVVVTEEVPVEEPRRGHRAAAEDPELPPVPPVPSSGFVDPPAERDPQQR